MFLKFFRDETGQSTLEYVMLISLLAVAVMVAVALLGNKTSNSLNSSMLKLYGS